jgi:mxaJ protein
VQNRKIDMAVVWGPLAGFYAGRSSGLALTPVAPQVDSGIPFTFALAVGVHKSDSRLQQDLDRAIEARQADIRRILASDHVPLLPLDRSPQGNGGPR